MKILSKYSVLLLSAVIAGNTVMAQNSNDPINQDKAGGVVNEKDFYQDAVNGSWRPGLVSEGVIDRVKHENRALEWNAIREIDIAYKTTVWRRIDVRQKQNQAFLYEGDEMTGGGAFIEILINAIKTGQIKAYADDKFTSELTGDDLKEKLGGKTVTETVVDPETNIETLVTRTQEFNVLSVSNYEIKEVWIFDRNSGRLIPRIISISPLVDVEREDGTGVYGVKKMFTVYYKDARTALAQYEVYNPENEVKRITWTDYFDSRYFSSYVIKTSRDNVLGNPLVKNTGEDIDGLMRGQAEFERIINKEQDMWEQ